MEKAHKLLWGKALHLASMARVRLDTLLLMEKMQRSESSLREKSRCDGQAIKHDYKYQKLNEPPLGSLLNLFKPV